MSLRLLGSLEALAGDRAVELGGPRQRSVLALLAVARGRVVPVDRIVDDLWRGEPPPRAMGALQAYISHLRRALEPQRPARAPAQVLVSAAPGYALRLPTEAVDAWRFEALVREGAALVAEDPAGAKERLDRALSLWRGPAYAEFADEEWAAPEAARLEELRVVGVEQRAEAALGLGMAAAAVPDLETHARAHPLREEAWRMLALALYRCGRQADALAALRQVRTTLAEELGIDPGPALQRLEADMLAQAPSLERSPERPARPAAAVRGEPAPVEPARTEPAPEALRAPFVGRRAELAALGEAAAAARSGHGRVALVAGDPGAGKSALVEALAATSDGEWLVAWGRCPEGAGAPAGWPWMELLRAVASVAPPPVELEARLAPFLDESMGEGAGEAAGDIAGDVPMGRFLLHRAVGRYLTSVAAERPLLLVLDDVHRADSDSLTLLGRVARDVRSSRTLLVATFRPAEVDEPLQETLASLAAGSPLRLELGGLGAAEVGELVRAATAELRDIDGPTLALITERTDGNPFYVLETARLLASEGHLDAATEVPAGVRDVLRRRVARLPARAQTVLRLASVIGRDVDVDVLVAVAAASDEGGEDEVLDALEAGLMAGLVTESAAGVRFAHVLVRDTLYDDISRLRRVRLHGRVADAVERLRPDDLPALAYHYCAAAASASPAPAIVDKALRYALEAARQARRRFAHAEAVALLEQGLETSRRAPERTAVERVRLLVELVPSRAYGGNAVGARTARTDAIREALAVGDEALVMQAVTSWTMPTPWSVRSYGIVDEEMLAWVDNAFTRLAPDDVSPKVQALRCRLLCCVVAELEGEDVRRADAAATEALRIARRLGDVELLVLALNARYFVTTPDSHRAERTRIAEELLEIGTSHGLPEVVVMAHHVATQNCGAVGDLDGVLEHATEATHLAELYGLRGPGVIAQLSLAFHQLITGDFAAAESAYEAALTAMARTGAYNAEALRWLTAYVQREVRGEDLADLLDWTRALFAEYPQQVSDPLVRVLLSCGLEDEARKVWNPHQPIRPDYFEVLLMCIRGKVAAQLGDRDAAEESYARLLPFTGHISGGGTASTPLWPVDHVLGDCAAVLGRFDQAEGHYLAAVELARRAGSPHFEAQALEALACLPGSSASQAGRK